MTDKEEVVSLLEKVNEILHIKIDFIPLGAAVEIAPLLRQAVEKVKQI